MNLRIFPTIRSAITAVYFSGLSGKPYKLIERNGGKAVLFDVKDDATVKEMNRLGYLARIRRDMDK